MGDTAEQRNAGPIWLHTVAGGLGGSAGDFIMHSIDTVKTRQQGAPYSEKYADTWRTYRTILREEGLLRGLYGGVQPAMMGSIPGTMVFFSVYETSKRAMLDASVNQTLAHLISGAMGDLTASVIYVPSEVLKTRLQLQGKFNNEFFVSGYNYRNTRDAVVTIVRNEGWHAMFHGYKATLMRDLPFSGLQFAFYEKFKELANRYTAPRNERLGLEWEMATGFGAGWLAGGLTTPLDVIKTRVQTQQEAPVPSQTATPNFRYPQSLPTPTPSMSRTTPNSPSHHNRFASSYHNTQPHIPSRGIGVNSCPPSNVAAGAAVKINTSSVWEALRLVYQTEGYAGLFRGAIPRASWTGAQSGLMFLFYENLMRSFLFMYNN